MKKRLKQVLRLKRLGGQDNLESGGCLLLYKGKFVHILQKRTADN